MEKQVIRAAVPETGGPFNMCVRHGDMIYVSGLPPFDAAYCAELRAARAAGKPLPPMPDLPFERQVEIVMDHLKLLVEAAASTMDCLLKVTVWLKDQSIVTGGRKPARRLTVVKARAPMCGDNRNHAPSIPHIGDANLASPCRRAYPAHAPPEGVGAPRSPRPWRGRCVALPPEVSALLPRRVRRRDLPGVGAEPQMGGP